MLSDLLRPMHRLLKTDHVTAIGLLTFDVWVNALDTQLATIHGAAAVNARGLSGHERNMHCTQDLPP